MGKLIRLSLPAMTIMAGCLLVPVRAQAQAVVSGTVTVSFGASGASGPVSLETPFVLAGGTLDCEDINAFPEVQVELLLDEAPLETEGESGPCAVRWDTTAVANGDYTLVARAFDPAGSETYSTPVPVTVSNSPPDGTFPAAHTEPPAVYLTGPAPGSAVSGAVTVSASAADDEGVVGVQFLLDGEPVGVEDFEAPYSITWDSTAAADGSHTLAARARDMAGNTATSAGAKVIVDNAIPATAEFPVLGGASVTVTAEASDNVGVAGLQFLLDGAPLGPEDTEAPYAFTWDSTTAPNGVHTLSAVARDAAGNQSTSAPVSVIVSNETGEPVADLSDAVVALTIPEDPTVYLTLRASSAPGVLAILAQASVVGVRRLELYIDRRLHGTAAGDILQYQWDTTSVAGAHEVMVIAYDAAGRIASSSMIYRRDL